MKTQAIMMTRRGGTGGVKSKHPLTKSSIRALGRRAGVKRIAGLVYDETRDSMMIFAEHLIAQAALYAESARRKTLNYNDVLHALQNSGRQLYF